LVGLGLSGGSGFPGAVGGEEQLAGSCVTVLAADEWQNRQCVRRKPAFASSAWFAKPVAGAAQDLADEFAESFPVVTSGRAPFHDLLSG